MSFQVKHQHVDHALGRHYIEIHNPDTGAEHHVVIYVGHTACPHCGHVKPVDNHGEIDLKQLLRDEIQALEKSHASTHAWAKKHNIPVLKPDGKAR